MPKTKVKKRRVTKTKVIPNPGTTGVNKILIDNFISLQKVMTNLSLRFDELSSQISKLLELFEISAKSLAKNDFESEKGNKNSEDIIEKLDNLIDQNKTIAKGLTLMHEMNPERKLQPPRPRPSQSPEQRTPVKTNEYQKSISSRDEKEI